MEEKFKKVERKNRRLERDLHYLKKKTLIYEMAIAVIMFYAIVFSFMAGIGWINIYDSNGHLTGSAFFSLCLIVIMFEIARLVIDAKFK